MTKSAKMILAKDRITTTGTSVHTKDHTITADVSTLTQRTARRTTSCPLRTRSSRGRIQGASRPIRLIESHGQRMLTKQKVWRLASSSFLLRRLVTTTSKLSRALRSLQSITSLSRTKPSYKGEKLLPVDEYACNKVHSDVYQDTHGRNVVTLFKIGFTMINSKSKAAALDESLDHSSSEDEKLAKYDEKSISVSNKKFFK
uniref:Uncharacterized protein n=1 Tax=Euplotes harpa TaxID=151035 RepID=A0A7S3J3I1_9SPIT|mmetsp:Transcript_18006/g.20766  ORF Transcript_18006/g.20766 Transcript_18006/m.20766 type:complete len:201 (+) Transcript_18006:132-734(+)